MRCLNIGFVLNHRCLSLNNPIQIKVSCILCHLYKGPFNDFVDKLRGEGSKNVCFCQRSTVQAGARGGTKWQNSVHVVIECSIIHINFDMYCDLASSTYFSVTMTAIPQICKG